MNQSTRWKRFIDWWGEEKFVGLSKEETLDLIQERIDDLRRPK